VSQTGCAAAAYTTVENTPETVNDI